MEVHAHTHTARKKWQHYFWEFFMLFLAVFCGFLAENVREHVIERHREYEYIKSMIADLKADTANLNQITAFSTIRAQDYDSLRKLLKRPNPFENTRMLYYYFMPTTYYNIFAPTRRTIDQLENSGGLRLIRDLQVSDSITSYYHLVSVAVSQGATWLRYFDQYHDIAFSVFDYSQIDSFFYDRNRLLSTPGNYTLLTNNKVEISILYNKLTALRFILDSYIQYFQVLNKEAVNTMEFLKKKYRL